MKGPVGVGVIGAGDISSAYLAGLSSMPDIALRGIASRSMMTAAEKGAPYGLPARSVEDLLGDPTVEIVLNLTPPEQHYTISIAALNAGKHVWSEKPLGTDLSQVHALIALAKEEGLRLGSAPDTFLGPASQAFRAAILSGEIGRPLSAFAAYETSGPELWHQNPSFLYDQGAGPLLDIGPYFVTELVHVFGPVSRVMSLKARSHDIRTVATGPRAGMDFPVRVDTSVLALLEFRNGAIAHLALSFDAPRNRGAVFELVGTKGQVTSADPDLFGSSPKLWLRGTSSARDLPLVTPGFCRGFGVLDLARAIRTGSEHRTNSSLALHVSEVLFAIASCDAGESVELMSGFPAPAPILPGWEPHLRT